MLRAQQTAKAIQEKCFCPIITKPNLREFRIGVLENQPTSRYQEIIQSAIQNGEYDTAEKRWHFKLAEGAESRAEVYERVTKCLREICRESSGKQVVAVTHAWVMKTLLGAFLQFDNDDISVENTGLITAS